MDRCLNIVKLLMIERGVEDPIEKERVRADMRAHASQCVDCAAIYDALTAPVDEVAVNEWRSVFGSGRSTSASTPSVVSPGSAPASADDPVTVVIDETKFTIPRRQVSGAELMALAAIPPDVGLIRVQEDGLQELVGKDQLVELRPGERFRRAPHFARG